MKYHSFTPNLGQCQTTRNATVWERGGRALARLGRSFCRLGGILWVAAVSLAAFWLLFVWLASPLLFWCPPLRRRLRQGIYLDLFGG